jgi:hypothetical protein
MVGAMGDLWIGVTAGARRHWLPSRPRRLRMEWEMIRSHLLRISARVRKTHRMELDPAPESLLNLRLYSRVLPARA